MYDISDYFPPHPSIQKKLWQDCIFIIDTSALLYFYYFSAKSRMEIFSETFDKIKDRICIPSHVMFEYLKNRESTIKKPIEEKYAKLKKNNMEAIEKAIKQISVNLEDFISNTSKEDSHPYIDNAVSTVFKNALNNFEQKFSNFKLDTDKEFKKREAEILSLLNHDTILEYIKSNFKIGSEYEFSKIIEIVNQGELRYRNEIPPGYKDFNKKLGTQKFGDLIIWNQVIDLAKEFNKPIILVTNDVKEDWCHSSKRRNEQRIERPREELIKELRDSANVGFWMYTFNQFLYHSKEMLNAQITKNVFDEAIEATSKLTEEHLRQLSPVSLSFEAGTTREAVEFVRDNLNHIGKLISISHSRISDEIYYETIINGEQGSIRVLGGLTSGYSGAGPNGLIRLLKFIGVDESTAEKLVKGNSEDKHNFNYYLPS